MADNVSGYGQGQYESHPDLMHEIAQGYKSRMLPHQSLLSDKLECDLFRKKFAGVLAHVSISLNEMNSNI